jgi:hypothetical protein
MPCHGLIEKKRQLSRPLYNDNVHIPIIYITLEKTEYVPYY